MSEDKFDAEEMTTELNKLSNALSFIDNMVFLDDHHEKLIDDVKYRIKNLMRWTIRNSELEN